MRLVVADFLTNTLIGEWREAGGVKWKLERDKPGTISGEIVDPSPGTLLGRPHGLYVLYPDGTIPWSGICWGVWPEGNTGNLYEFEGAGWQSILDFRVIGDDITYRDDDQATIFADIISRASTGVNGDPGWTVVAPATGIARDVTIKGQDVKTALKYLTDWADNINGYDFRAYAESDFTRKIEMQYPRDSRQSHTIISRPGIEVTRWEDDWTWVANNIYMGGEDELEYFRPGNPEPSWPRLDVAEKADSVSVMSTLVEKAERYYDLHRDPLVAAQVTVYDGPSGASWIGDDIRVIDGDVSGRDATFQLISIEGSWAGSQPVEVWNLAQTLRQEEQ